MVAMASHEVDEASKAPWLRERVVFGRREVSLTTWWQHVWPPVAAAAATGRPRK